VSAGHPRISIVTLSFNQGRFLDTAIRSILDQGYPNLDYVVVDPGSRDDSRTIIARHAGRLTALLDPDKGPADGLNNGFAAATGDIFGYINADDLLLPGALATIARHFEDPAVDAILGNGILIDAAGQTRRKMKSSRPSRGDIGHGVMTFVQQGHWFRRSAFDAAGGFNIANRTCWDGELLVDMVLAGARFRNVPEQLGGFRLYGETITGSGRLAEAMALDIARVRAKALGRPPAAADRIVGPLRLLARRLADPAATLEGLRARLAPNPAHDAAPVQQGA
jgi:glycosyltransferase involved in cell wall biosynthesis